MVQVAFARQNVMVTVAVASVTVQKELTAQVAGSNELVAEASEIGLRPGEWPTEIVVVDEEQNGYVFERAGWKAGDTDLLAVSYRTADGALELTVLND